jgi:uncharacterized protein (DUF362 family)/NAD-dependent dihydropyrimidine dehydrogenase PreA subunit
MDSRSIVSIKRVADYQAERVQSVMRECLEPLGGMQAVVKPGQTVLIKPNLLGGFPVDQAVTTHPAVVRAAILLTQEAGGRVWVGDSPGMGTLERVAAGCGLAPVLAETGAQLVDLSTPDEFEAPDNVVAKRITLAKALREVDVLISLPKLKTHAQMTLTAALKNQYGLVPGTLKSQWHFRLERPEWLAALILDINRVARPALALMDAVIAMEGLGPSAGKPRWIGALLASRDLAAVDTMACHLIGLDPLRVPTLAAARKQHWGATALEDITIVGDDWRPMRVPDFKKIEQTIDLLRQVPLPQPMLRWIRRQWTARPRIIDGRCTQCGICEDGCPVSPAAIHPGLKPAQRIEDDRCIRCYCCHEFCPAHAIDLKQTWLSRHLRLNPIANRVGDLLARVASLRKGGTDQ